MNKEDLFVALVFYGVIGCGFFWINIFSFGGADRTGDKIAVIV